MGSVKTRTAEKNIPQKLSAMHSSTGQLARTDAVKSDFEAGQEHYLNRDLHGWIGDY